MAAVIFTTNLTAPSHPLRFPTTQKLPPFLYFFPSKTIYLSSSSISAQLPTSGLSPISCTSSSSPLGCFTVDEGTPWEGAVVYRRDASVTHLEYCTTLESLGLEKLSSETSKARASSIGIRVTKAVKDFPFGTPVQISMDVYRKKKKLRLEGIIKTVITLPCNKCGVPAAKCVFSDFQLLLQQDPIEASDKVFVGSFYGDQVKSSSGGEGEEDDEDSTLDVDEQLHFPAEEKEIDISKPIRDSIHVEITIDELCDPACKGSCLRCGANLNRDICHCGSKQQIFR